MQPTQVYRDDIGTLTRLEQVEVIVLLFAVDHGSVLLEGRNIDPTLRILTEIKLLADTGTPGVRWPGARTATQSIQVGTWVANIYLRHSYVCAQGASLIAEATGGRFILGLGVSHQPVNDALQIDMSNATEDVGRYTNEVAAWLRGDGPEHLRRQR